MGMQSVRETPQGLRFPPQIARQRGHQRTIASLIASGLSLAIGCAFTNEDRLIYLLNSHFSGILILGGVELIRRVCAIFEEKRHIQSRYDNKLKNLLHDVFSFTLPSLLAIFSSSVILLLTFIISNRNPVTAVLDKPPIAVIFAIVSVLLLRDILQFEESPWNKSLQIHALDGLDYGSGMAHSFFHGYLRIVLPHSGRENDKGIKEFLQVYEANNNVEFDVYKLFILIPFSQHCPPSLANSKSVEVSKELESKEVDRAGVKNRNYKNSVYKIKTASGRKVYVAAEYATPVKTLFEVMTQNTACSHIYERHRVDILLNFYLTLRSLLKGDPDCCDVCEPIYYDDKDENGKFCDVGEIIWARIKQLKKSSN